MRKKKHKRVTFRNLNQHCAQLFKTFFFFFEAGNAYVDIRIKVIFKIQRKGLPLHPKTILKKKEDEEKENVIEDLLLQF